MNPGRRNGWAMIATIERLLNQSACRIQTFPYCIPNRDVIGEGAAETAGKLQQWVVLLQ